MALFDPFSGASGDMILGALIDAGAPLTAIEQVVTDLGLEGVVISAAPAASGAVRGTHVTVSAADHQPARDWSTIRVLLQDSALADDVREAAIAVFAALAAAEAKAHGTPLASVHFHEVGAVDAIVDIVGACACLAALGITQIVSHPVATGAGWVQADHGLLPVPAPATAILLANAHAPLRPDPPGPIAGELLTPTGAAILTTLAAWRLPAGFTPERVAYGFGSRELPWPNALRLWIGEQADATTDDTEILLETNIDDMNPQFYAPLLERLFAAGALDAWLSPATMKKGRPATVVSAIIPARLQDEVVRTLILESTTLGVRATQIARTRAPRRFETVITRWGEVQLKLRGWHGRVIGAMPEYDDCLRLSRQHDVPIREVWAEANRLGEVYIGQHWGEDDKSK